MAFPNITTLEQLVAAINEYVVTPRRPALQGSELNIILNKMITLIPGGGGGSVNWGDITGDITDQSDLLTEFASKVNTADVLNALDQVASGKVLDARQGKILNDLITALNGSTEKTANKNQPNGYAGLDGSGKVAAAQLPSYVDDVLEFANFAALPGTGETGKIYITIDTNNEYRWSGSAYIQIVASPGTTDAVPEGSTNKYFTAARVLATVLTGIGFSTATAVTASDNILQAFGKLQAQITALFKIPAGGTSGQVLTKVDGTDGNVQWSSPAGGGVSGLSPKEVLFGKSDGTIEQNSALAFDPATGTIYNNAVSEANSKQIVGIGDSITQDTGASDHAHCYFALLSNLLGLTENNQGVSGKTAGTYDSSLIPNYTAGTSKYITFAFGTNDVNFGDSASTFNTNYTNLVSTAHAKGWPYASMFFVSIPGLFNNGIVNSNTPIALDCNTAMSNLATSLGATYVDIWTPLRNDGYYAPIANNNITFDSNHPNDLGHFLIAKIVANAIKPIFTFTDQGLIINKKTELLNLAIRNAPLLQDGHIVAIDKYGNVGVIPYIPAGTRTKGVLKLGGSLVQDGAIPPIGYDAVKDNIYVVDAKISCAGNNSGSQTAIVPFGSVTGAMEFRHYAGSGTFAFFGGPSGTTLLFTIDVGTGKFQTNYGMLLPQSTEIRSVYNSSIFARLILFDGNYDTVIENTYDQGHLIERVNVGAIQYTFASGAKVHQAGGTFSEEASSIHSVNSTTRGSIPWPRMTTTQKNAISSPAEGLSVWDTTLHKLCCYDGTTWQTAW